MGDMSESVKVTMGIRKGWSVSTFLLILITFKIIKELRERGEIMQVGMNIINSIWFANHTTFLDNTVKALRKTIILAKEVTKKFGLEINEDKSKIVCPKGEMNFTYI